MKDRHTCKFKDCNNKADSYFFNPEIHWSAVGICNVCLSKMKQGIPYVTSYYNCGVRKDIVEIEFGTDMPIQISLFEGEIIQ